MTILSVYFGMIGIAMTLTIILYFGLIKIQLI